MAVPRIIAAVGTPLTAVEQLHVERFENQLERVWSAGMSGVFVGGTLGAMPLLTDDTYRTLIEQAAHLTHGKGELFVGASDQSLARTRERIDYVNRFAVDGVVVLPPYFIKFSQQEIVAYYRALADASRAPLYLYDLPQRTHVTFEHETTLTLAEHPNIAGIKCSGPVEHALRLIDQLAQRETLFRVILAQPDRLQDLIATGVNHHLDGIYALAPRWTMRIVKAVQSNDGACTTQADLTELRNVMRRHGGLSALTVLMNAVGIPGNFAPAPFQKLTRTQCDALLDEPVVQKFLSTEHSISAST